MKITVINRKGPENTKIKPYPIEITMPELMVALWNVQEKPHGKFWQKYNSEAHMSIKEAQAILDELFKKEDDGPIRETLKSQKHDGAKKYLGMTLIGDKGDFGIIWREAVINQTDFLKHRDENRANGTLDDLMLSLSRAAIKKSALAKDKRKTSKQPSKDYNSLTPKPDGIHVEPIDSGTPQSPTAQTESWYKRLLKSPLLHGIITSGLSALGLFFSKVGTGMTIGGSLGIGLLAWATETLYFWRKDKQNQSYHDFEKMNPEEIQALDQGIKQALNAGLDSKAWLSWGKSVFDTSAWKKYNAFSAGLKASENENDRLAETIRPRAKI